MALQKEKKVEILKKLKDIVADSKSVVFVNFHGLPVTDSNAMRKKLRDDSVGYYVARKTLVKRILSDSSISGDTPQLDGELALAYGKDSVVPASSVYEFVKKHKENIAILGGIFEGVYKSKDEMTEIASIPPLEVLYGQFANVINSPIQGFVMALGEIAKKKEA